MEGGLSPEMRAEMLIDRMVALLKASEWIEDNEYNRSYCPCCGRDSQDKHEPVCELKQVLDEYEREHP